MEDLDQWKSHLYNLDKQSLVNLAHHSNVDMGSKPSFYSASTQPLSSWHAVEHNMDMTVGRQVASATASMISGLETVRAAVAAASTAVERAAVSTKVLWHSKRQRTAVQSCMRPYPPEQPPVEQQQQQQQLQQQQQQVVQMPPSATDAGQDSVAKGLFVNDWPTQEEHQWRGLHTTTGQETMCRQPPQVAKSAAGSLLVGLHQHKPHRVCMEFADVDDDNDNDDDDDDDDGDQNESQGGNAAAYSDDENMDAELVSADFNLTRDQVVERIEQLALQLAASAAAGQLPQLTCISTAASNVRMAQQHAPIAGRQQRVSSAAINVAFESGMDDGIMEQERHSTDQQFELGGEQRKDVTAAAEVDPGQQHVVRLGSKTQTRTLTANGGSQAYGIVRVLQLLATVHSLLRAGRTATQRDLYYTLLAPPFFNTSKQLTSTIHTALALLRVPRAALGIAAASKGAVAGKLLLRFRPGEAWHDCSLTGTAGRAIPGEAGAVEAIQMRLTGARFVLVVEKDAVFQRLVEDRLFDQLPCVIITGRGMPDVASRAFLAALVAAAAPGSHAVGSLPVLGLVDWNPGGVAILLAYKHGSAAMGLETARYAVPSLAWLGLTSDMMQDVPGSACQPLTQRDKAQITNLKPRLASCPDWAAELEEMLGIGLKVDIEALYGVVGHAGLAEELARRVLSQQYLV